MADGSAPPPVVVAGASEAALAIVARVVEAEGHRVVRVGPFDGDHPADEVADAVRLAMASAAIIDLGAATPATVQALLASGDHSGALRIVALTDGPATAERARHAGAHRALGRPFHARDLVQALEGVLGDSTSTAAGPRPSGGQDQDQGPEPTGDPREGADLPV